MFDKSFKKDLLIQINISTMILISLFYCCEKVFTHTKEKVSETSLPENEVFYSHLNIEEITDADYTHKKSDDEIA